MALSIVVDPKTIELHPDGVVTGVVYWDADGIAFPESCWNDFVLVVIEWWLAAILRILKDETTVERMDFMDGPFCVVIEVERNSLKLSFIERRSSAHKIAITMSVTREALCRAAIATAEQLVQACLSLGISSSDFLRIQELGKALLEAANDYVT
jgi:hypothetical protein